jgi:hypothetical protein
MSTFSRSVGLGLVLALAACRKEPEPERVEEAVQAKAEPPAVSGTPSVNSELPPGPRAPTTAAFGLTVGKSTRAEADARMKSLGVECSDTGPRALMESMREKKKAELEEATKTSDADAVSGASVLGKKSKKEKNPQIRLSCPDVRMSQLGVERVADAPGRALIIFDGPEAPLRHVGSRRSHAELSTAVADAEEAVAAWTALLGPPTTTRGDPAGLAPPEPTETSARWEWTFADYHVRVGILSIGGKRFSVSERAEVPMRIRADAPTLAQAPQDSPSAQ